MREDISPSLRTALEGWLARWLDGTQHGRQRAHMVAAAIDLPEVTGGSLLGNILSYTDERHDRILDTIHATLGVIQMGDVVYTTPPHQEVDRLLALGRSAWMATKDGLVHRAEPTAQAAFDLAAASGGQVSDELREAWANAYNRESNASDAWDHAIKAVELVYIPIVCPNKAKANLGSVAGELKAQPGTYTLGLHSNGIGGIQTVEAMIRLIWPNPDRHGSPSGSRTPTLQEARAVVTLAVTLVQWGTDNLIAKK